MEAKTATKKSILESISKYEDETGVNIDGFDFWEYGYSIMPMCENAPDAIFNFKIALIKGILDDGS